MLKGGNPLTVGVGIVIEVIRKNNSDYDLDSQAGPEPTTSDPIYLGTMLRQFSNHIPDFMTLVRSPKATKPELKSAFGRKIQPLGFDRFKTCELMAELLHCSNMGLLNERGSDGEMRLRDLAREQLKEDGKLRSVPTQNSFDADEPFASSVDSHGFHHAEAPPADELNESPEKVNRLEVQNASDEDGFEKVGVPDSEDMPDEVTFDVFNEKLEETRDVPEQPATQAQNTEQSTPALSDQMERLRTSESDQPQSEGQPRVSSLTRQIQSQIEDTEQQSTTEDTEMTDNTNTAAAVHPEDKPAPLFASKASPEKGADPVLGDTTPDDEQDTSIMSIATLQPEQGNVPTEFKEQTTYEVDVDGTPVVGDLLKMQFVEYQVVPTILVSISCAHSHAAVSIWCLRNAFLTQGDRTSSSASLGTTSSTMSFTTWSNRSSTAHSNVATTVSWHKICFSNQIAPPLLQNRKSLNEFSTAKQRPSNRRRSIECVSGTWVI